MSPVKIILFYLSGVKLQSFLVGEKLPVTVTEKDKKETEASGADGRDYALKVEPVGSTLNAFTITKCPLGGQAPRRPSLDATHEPKLDSIAE